MTTFKFYPVTKFQLYDTELLVIVTMFCVRFSELFYIIAEKVCTFVPTSSCFSYSPAHGNHFYKPFLWLFCFVLDSTYKWYYEVFIFLSLTYFSLSIIASKSIHVVTNGRILFFFSGRVVVRGVHTTYSLSIHLYKATQMVSISWLL